MEKGDLSEKSEACMHDRTWLRLAKFPYMRCWNRPSLLQRLRHGAARKMRDRYRVSALRRRWCVRCRGRHGTDGARGLGFDACCECLQISSSPTLARPPGRAEPVQAPSQQKGLRSRAFFPLSCLCLVFGSMVCRRMR